MTRAEAAESALRACVAELDRVLDLDVYHRRVARNDWSRCDQPCRGCEVGAAAEAGRKALAGVGEAGRGPVTAAEVASYFAATGLVTLADDVNEAATAIRALAGTP